MIPATLARWGALLAPILALSLVPPAFRCGQAPAPTAPPQPVALPIPEDLAAAVERAQRVGRELFGNDRASARATDALLAKLGSLEDRGLGGYLALHEAAADGTPAPSWLVFFTSDEAPPHVLYRVRVPAGEHAPEIVDTPEPLPLPEELVPLLAARERAIEAGAPYEQTVNPLVLRGKDVGSEGTLVFLLAATDQPDLAVLGRHQRVELSADGAKVERIVPLSKGAIELPLRTRQGQRVPALMLTHVLGDAPTESHVLASLQHSLPIFVATARGLWKVEPEALTFFGKPEAPKCVLELTLRERGSGAPRAGRVQLWQLGVPADPPHGPGDRNAGSYDVPAEGLSIPDLEPGTYRVQCSAQALSAGDPPAFELRAPRTPIALELDVPREREATLELVDADGRPFESAEFELGTRSGALRIPEWLHPRQVLATEEPVRSELPGGGTSSRSVDQKPRRVVHGGHGLVLGSELEDGGLHRTRREFTLRVPQHGKVWGVLPCDGREELCLRMLLVEKARFEGVFLDPDGQPLDLGRVQVSTPVEPDQSPRPEGWWREVPITLSVDAPGCAPLQLEYRLREGPLAPRRLKRRG